MFVFQCLAIFNLNGLPVHCQPLSVILLKYFIIVIKYWFVEYSLPAATNESKGLQSHRK